MMIYVKPTKRSVAKALFRHDNLTNPVAWHCAKCGRVYLSDEDAACCSSKGCAEWTCSKCGKPCTAFQSHCTACLGKLYEARSAEKLEKAKRVLLADYGDEPVVWAGRYFQSVELLLEYCEDEGFKPPKLVHATRPVPFKLNIEETIEQAFEEWVEGADGIEMDMIEGLDEIKEAAEAFNEANTETVLNFETDTAVDIEGAS